MKLTHTLSKRDQGSALMAYLVIGLVVIATLTSFASYVIKMIHLSHRRQNMALAHQFAQGGAAIASRDVRSAYTNAGPLGGNLLANPSGPYTRTAAAPGAAGFVYSRTILAPFAGQAVDLEIHLPNEGSPGKVRVVATAAVGGVVQSVESFLALQFGYTAAIISTHPGTSSDDVGKGTAQQGNTVIQGGGGTATMVTGGVMANGMVNTNNCIVDRVDSLFYGTQDELPDYTDPGSDHQLFDFTRFTAVADATGNHYASLKDFVDAAKTQTLEGVIVVDISKSDKTSLDPKTLPNGINVRGTLIFKFDSGWKPMDKLVNTATLNINAADLQFLNASDPATYTSSYPPIFADGSKDPTRVDISGKGFQNFTPEDDLPALMYNNAILDLHGGVNISGVVYSPSFMEIENKKKGQIQYIRGAVIGGGGIFIENKSGGTSVISYDYNALDLLATEAQHGKTVELVFQR